MNSKRSRKKIAPTDAVASPPAAVSSGSLLPAPTNVEEYIIWAKQHLQVNHDERLRSWYEAGAGAAQEAAQSHPFYATLGKAMKEADEEYQNERGLKLLMDSEDGVKLLVKPYISMIDKSLRKNILENKLYPAPPEDGWLLPSDWFDRNNDTIRTVVTCKYIDGPEWLLERLVLRANALNLTTKSKSQQNDDGYYAFHFWVAIPAMINDRNWDAKAHAVSVEIQLTSQLQEVLRSLTHDLYEVRRLTVGGDAHRWKWNTKEKRFKAAYIGHALHLLEALVLDLKEVPKHG